MQWLESVFKFFGIFFKSNAFKNKYRTQNLKNLKKISKSDKWQIIDIRNSVAYEEHHIIGSKNIPKVEFARKFFSSIKKDKNILLINSNYRSDLEIYKLLKKHHLKVYILYANYEDIRNNGGFDDITSVIV